jgi:hypothetical protein
MSDKMQMIHDEAMKRFNASVSASSDERKQALRDRRFCDVPGAQWEGSWGEQFANRPRCEVNKVALAVQRIINEYRNNRITVDFVSRDGAKNDELADLCDGLYRADEADSNADEAKDNAFDEMVKGGYGAWRLCTDYEDPYDDSTTQRIRIEPIYEAESVVWWDPNAKRYDKADAKWCMVLSPMSHDAYREMFGKEPTGIGREVNNSEFDWVSTDLCYVGEYYAIEEPHHYVFYFDTLIAGGDRKHFTKDELTDEVLAELAATGYFQSGKKRKTSRKVRKVIMDGSGPLEDCGHIAGDQIPIVPCYGKRSVIDGVERVSGHVRNCKDAQMIKNVELSTLVETASLSAIEKPIFLPEQVAGHQLMWQNDNVTRYPYLLVNKITTQAGDVISGPQAYTKAPSIPPALAALLQISETDMNDILGNQGAGDKLLAGVSGRAVEQIQGRLDMQSFIYMSNFAKSVQRCGEIWMSMKRDVYVEPERKMKTMSPQGSVGQVEINRPIVNDEGERDFDNNLAEAKFGVFVEVGPTYQSQREAVTRSLIQVLPMADPATQQIIQAMLMTNMDGEGMGDIREYFRRKLVELGVNKPTPEDEERMAAAAQGQTPDPQTQLALSMAAEAEAKAQKAQADTVGSIADAEYTRAKTIETLANVDEMDREKMANTVRNLILQYGIRPDELGEYAQERNV